jgi:DNA-binding MarR family transcriptional regulator
MSCNIHDVTQAPAEDLTTPIIEVSLRYMKAVMHRLPTEVPGVGGVTREQLPVLGEVAKAGDPGLSMGELAGRTGLALNSATALVDRLVVAGLLERRQDVNDRRVVRVSATAAGHQLREAILAARRAEYERLLAELSPEDLMALRAAVPALARLAEAARR